MAFIPAPTHPRAGLDWLAGFPGVVARLEKMRRPRIAHVGCGRGEVALALARAFLDAHVDGLDRDPVALAIARGAARAGGLDNRVAFRLVPAGDLTARGPSDLVLLGAPGALLATVAGALAPGGAAITPVPGGGVLQVALVRQPVTFPPRTAAG